MMPPSHGHHWAFPSVLSLIAMLSSQSRCRLSFLCFWLSSWGSRTVRHFQIIIFPPSLQWSSVARVIVWKNSRYLYRTAYWAFCLQPSAKTLRFILLLLLDALLYNSHVEKATRTRRLRRQSHVAWPQRGIGALCDFTRGWIPECFSTLFLKSGAKKEVKGGLLPVEFTDWLETHIIVRKYCFLDFCTTSDL